MTKKQKIDFTAIRSAINKGGYLDTIGQNITETKKTKRGRGRPVTYIVTEELQENIKKISHWTGASVKEVVNRALSEYVATYEKKRGPLKPIPNDKLKL
jgi:hypothetical protein